jgi:hypothetical protein
MISMTVLIFLLLLPLMVVLVIMVMLVMLILPPEYDGCDANNDCDSVDDADRDAVRGGVYGADGDVDDYD